MPPHTDTEQQPVPNVVVELQLVNKNQAVVHADHEYKLDIHLPETCHQISQDSWFQVGFILTTTANSAYVLGYSGTVMVPLGWIGGVMGLMLAAAISFYANVLIAKLHECGGKRHIRYRDLAGHIYGRKGYVLTWVLQYVNLFMINIGFIILAGQAVKAVYVLLSDDGALKLPYCIAIAGFVCAVFATGVPHLSALRIWLGVSTFLSLVYIVIGLALSFKDGLEAPRRDYSIPVTDAGRVFQTIGAAANLVIAFNSGMLPEIQATVRQPVVGNMIKALYLQFTVSCIPIYAITFIGYWAYGSSTSTYLLNSVNGPVWVKAMANISALLQTVITLAVSTLSAALLPFLGDFMSLTGAISIFPLTFILANHMYLMVKGNKMSSCQKAWHWLNIVVFSTMSVAATVSAIKLILVDSKNFHVFADL